MADKVVLVSGGTKGIGKAIVQQMLREGNRVITFSSQQENVDKLREELSTTYGERKFLVVKCDIKDAEALEGLVRNIISKFGRIDMLVNNSGIGYFTSLEEVNLDKFQEMLQINIFGLAVLTKLVVPSMKSISRGHIINISSISGKRATANGEFYSASKFAVQGFSEGIRNELKPFGIKVSTVCPGMIETDFFSKEELNRRATNNGGTKSPMLEVEHISKAVSFIANQPDVVEIQDIVIMPYSV